MKRKKMMNEFMNSSEVILLITCLSLFGFAFWYAWRLDQANNKNKALRDQIDILTEQAIIYEKAKKSAAGKKGIETIKWRWRNEQY
jgi:hypothetical protein